MSKLNNLLFINKPYYEYAYIGNYDSIIAFESACNSFRYQIERDGKRFDAGKINAGEPVKIGQHYRIIFKYII